jgi:hypothetical protein
MRCKTVLRQRKGAFCKTQVMKDSVEIEGVKPPITMTLENAAIAKAHFSATCLSQMRKWRAPLFQQTIC